MNRWPGNYPSAAFAKGRLSPGPGASPRDRGAAWLLHKRRLHGDRGSCCLDHSCVTRNRNALPTTLTDDSAMAAAAMIGESRIPKVGYRIPAAIGIPAAL